MSKKKYIQRFVDYPVIMRGKELQDMGIYVDKDGYLIPATSKFYVWLTPGHLGLQATNQCRVDDKQKNSWDKLVEKYKEQEEKFKENL